VCEAENTAVDSSVENIDAIFVVFVMAGVQPVAVKQQQVLQLL